jgi:uncharacterized membrane protein YdjX (TVP38/TMEM64 family)
MTDTPPAADSDRSRAWAAGVKLAVIVIIGVAVGAAYWSFRDRISLESLAAQESALRDVRSRHPVLVYGVAFAAYVLVTALSLPLATVMSLVVGWYFGVWRGVVLVSFASTTGATLAFLASRFLLRDAIQSKFGDRLAAFNAALERDGALYLFLLRLTFVVPFWIVNLVMGLTRLRTWTFWWVSQLGMLPGTCLYVYAGASVPDLQTLADRGARGIVSPQLLIALLLLGLFPLVSKRLIQRWRPTVTSEMPSLPPD